MWKQHEFYLWAAMFCLHLLFCIISNRASDATCMFWTRWLLITSSKWNYRSPDKEILIPGLVLTLLSLAGRAKHCQSGCHAVNSAKRVFGLNRSPQFSVCFTWHHNEQHDNLTWKHQVSLSTNDKWFLLFRFHFTSSIKASRGKRSFVFWVQSLVQLIHFPIAHLGAMIMPPPLCQFVRPPPPLCPFNRDSSSSARIKAAVGVPGLWKG